MANKNFSGVLRDPTGELAYKDKFRFTHVSTTGEVIRGSISYVNIPENGAYDFDLEYGNILIQSRDKLSSQWIRHGVVTINQDTTVTTLPALLLASVPATPELVLQLEQILNDAETAASDAAQSATDAQASADSVSGEVETIEENTDVIKSLLIAQGLSGNYGFFEKGFTYNEVGDVGIAADGKIYTYVGGDTLPVSVAAGTNPVGDGDYIKVSFSAGTVNSDLSLAFIDQFTNNFHGRGMLASEKENTVSEQSILSYAPSGASVISISDTSNFEVGGLATIYHGDEGVYRTYFIKQKTGSTLGFSNDLKFSVDVNSRVERTWFNQAHPGKFYMRELAQTIARSKNYEVETASAGRLLFNQFDVDQNLTPVGGTSISYFDELNLGQGVYSKPVEMLTNKTAFISISGNAQGAETPLFNRFNSSNAIVKVTLMSRDAGVNVQLQVIDEDNSIMTKIDLHTGDIGVHKKYSVPVRLPAKTEKCKIRVVVSSGFSGNTALIIDNIEVFDSLGDMSQLIPNRNSSVLLGLGDSWIAGDASQPQRESILTQLALELPNCTIVNKGVGGNKIWQMLARFETDVVPYKPNYVILNTGTNDCYSPSSGVFFPNSVDAFIRDYNELISKIVSIGAKPIVIGVPALAEEDGSRVNFELNDKAKTYVRYFNKYLSSTHTEEGESPVPTDINTTIESFTPILDIGGATEGISYSTQRGSYVKIGNLVNFNVQIQLTSKGLSTGTIHISIPPLGSASADVTPCPTFAAYFTATTNVQSFMNIGSVNKIRLHDVTPTGAPALTEINVNDNSFISISGSYFTLS